MIISYFLLEKEIVKFYSVSSAKDNLWGLYLEQKVRVNDVLMICVLHREYYQCIHIGLPKSAPFRLAA